jgi:ferredoxin
MVYTCQPSCCTIFDYAVENLRRDQWTAAQGKLAKERSDKIMKVRVDNAMCEGNLECMIISPEVFSVSSDNQAQVLVDEIPSALEEQVRLAVQACPRAALIISE